MNAGEIPIGAGIKKQQVVAGSFHFLGVSDQFQ